MMPKKRSFSIAGHKTSISIEEPFWQALRDIASEQDVPLSALVAQIDSKRGEANLSSAVRVHILAHFRARAAADQSSSSAAPATGIGTANECGGDVTGEND